MRSAIDLAQAAGIKSPDGYKQTVNHISIEALERLVMLVREDERQAWQHEPVARVTGFFAGQCVIEALDPAVVLPIGMALYKSPLAKKEQSDCAASQVVDKCAHIANFRRSPETLAVEDGFFLNELFK